ncbi:ABC transporter permease [Aurantibacillus circumpalustris]|uniref:ABC transporter permease n=1 Tax=Aurantibacillus circumpalustris TaxID=3036359 RepID=UPI00295AEFF6|nr:ABC transporter permease [Aurantibacillus circumpalustris]
MFDIDKWQEIFGTIKKNMLRTILTAFSVAWGIFILIVLLAAGQGLRNGAQSQFGNDAANSIWINGGQTSIPFEGYKPGKQIQLTNNDFYYIKNDVNDVDNTSAVYKGWESKVLSYKKEHVAFTFRPVAPDHNKLERAKLIAGRFINEIDFKEFRKVCAIGLPVKEALFKDEDPLNKFIDAAGTQYKVVGVFNDPGRGDNDRIYVPLLTAQRINGGKDYVNTIWASTGNASIERSQQMSEEIRQHLSKKYHFDPKDLNAVGIYNNNIEYKRIMGMLDGIKIFVFIIGVLTLIAGVVGVSNIMMIIVKERTREIGVRKALGATPYSIVSLIIQESIFITFVAGYVGLMLGIGLVELMRYLKVEGDFFKNPEVDISIAISAVILIIIAGALAGLFPAIKAARVEPIHALRED